MDRRVFFFAGAAGVALLVTPLAPDEFRWVGLTVVITYMVFSLLFLADSISHHRSRRE
jgi:uncharacterized membrane protein